jgi:hypothetical protein
LVYYGLRDGHIRALDQGRVLNRIEGRRVTGSSWARSPEGGHGCPSRQIDVETGL